MIDRLNKEQRTKLAAALVGRSDLDNVLHTRDRPSDIRNTRRREVPSIWRGANSHGIWIGTRRPRKIKKLIPIVAIANWIAIITIALYWWVS